MCRKYFFIAVLFAISSPLQTLATQAYNFEDGAGFVYEDFELSDYRPYKSIKMDMVA